MNQILITEKKKKSKKAQRGPIEVKGIVRFFAVFIMFLLAEQPVSAIDSKITAKVNKQFFFFIRIPHLNLIFCKHYIYIYILY